MKKTLIIAEAGVNHNGDLNLAKKLIEIAADSGADFVKFQSFKAKNCISTKAKKAPYQLKTTASDESQKPLVGPTSRLPWQWRSRNRNTHRCGSPNAR